MKKTTYCLALLLLTVLQSFGQVFIGNGTNQEQHIPFDAYYGYTYSQSIYTAEEVNATGTINSIAWYFSGPAGHTLPNSQNIKLYIGHTTKSVFSSNTDWQAATDMTLVYTGSINVNGPGWVTLQLTTPFAYNGTDNLVIATAELQSGYDSTDDNFSNTETSGNRSLAFFSDGTVPDPATPPSGDLASFVPNILIGGISPSCLVPQFLSVHNITDTAATVFWATLGAPPTGGSQYYVSTSATNPNSGTVATGSVANGSMAEISSGLTANTDYFVWVRNVCDGTPGAWSFSSAFKTACTPVSTFTADFDTAATGTLPDCWSAVIRGTTLEPYTTISVTNTNAHSGQNSIKIDNGNTPNTSDIILVSPRVNNLGNGTHRLKFFAYGATANSLQVGTIDESTPTGTFTSLQPVQTTNSYTEYTVNFSTYTGTNTYIAIRLNSESLNSPVFVDDIRWELTPNCADVTDLAVGPITTQTAVVSWNANGTAAWEVAYSSTANEPTGLTAVPATQISTTLPGLTPNTAYKVWVRSICGSNPGAWIGPLLFTTKCDATAAFNENFDAVTVPQLPGCWSKILRGATLNSSATVQTATFNIHSAPNSVYIAGWNSDMASGADDVILVSPNLVGLAEGTNRIKFFAKGPGVIQVGTLDSNTNTAIFTSVETLTLTAAYTEYSIDFKEYEGTDTYVGFRLVSTPPNGVVNFDDIRWEQSPACADVYGIAASGLTPSSATIHWEANDEIQWEVIYATPEVTDLDTLTPIYVENQPTTTIPALAANTTYNAWVRTICSDGVGSWIGPVSFKTDCIAVNEFSENFDGVTIPQLPGCWSKIIRGNVSTDAFIRTSTDKSHSANNAIRFYSGTSLANYDIILASPRLGNLSNSTHRLRFYAAGFYNTTIQVGTLNSNEADATFTPFGAPTAITPTYAEYTFDFTQYGGTDKYIAIRFTPPFLQMDVFIDDIVWEQAPACPDVNTITVTDINTVNGLVHWNAANEETKWQVSHAVATTTDANTGIIEDVLTTPSLQLNGLAPATTYKVWVRSVCDGNAYGNWVGPIQFTTSCTPASTFSQDAEAAVTPALPTCWTGIRRGAGLNSSSYIITSSYEPFAGNQGFFIYSGSPFSNPATSDIILVSPPVDNLAGHTNSLSFYLKGTANIVVGTLNSNAADAIFTPFNTTITGTDSYVKYTVNFDTYTGTDQYIGLRYNGPANALISIDNIVWDLSLSNGDFENADFSAYPNPVKDVLNLSYKNAISNISVYNLLGQKVIDKTINSTTATVNMASLSGGTYIVKVMADNKIKTLKIIKN